MTNAVFIVANVFFTFVDLTARPAFMLQYKIQEDKNVPVRQTVKVFLHFPAPQLNRGLAVTPGNILVPSHPLV